MMRNAGRSNASREESVPRAARILLPVLLWLGLSVAPHAIAVPASASAACAIPRHGSEEPPVESADSTADEDALPAVIEVEGDRSDDRAERQDATPAAGQAHSDEALAEELTAASDALAACLSAGDVEMVVQLAGERYLGQMFGSSVPMSREEYIAIAHALTPVPTRIVELDAVTLVKRGEATALVTHVVGNQLMQAEWAFERVPRGERDEGENDWRIVAERQLPAATPRGAQVIDVEIKERSFALDRQTVSGPDVVLRGENLASEDHEMLVLRYAPGYSSADLLRATGPDLPSEVTYIGEIPVRAGSARDLVLVDLEPGIYTLVCLFPDADGIPHLAYGMEATFTVE
jgi:hypothetical protein